MTDRFQKNIKQGSEREGQETLKFDFIIGQHPSMLEILEIVSRTAKTDVTLLIQGETGTGKELIAKAIHLSSRRNTRPFIPINCAAIPDNLMESEMFGYDQGAFTGANHDKKGWFEQADRGTIFLDEVGEMSRSLQTKLLRVLQFNEFSRLGSTEFRRSDLRVIGATSRNLLDMVEQNQFCKETYYRLSVIEINLPPLHQRRSDILLLAEYFLNRFGKEYEKDNLAFSKEANEALFKYDFPGNVRELEHAVHRAVIMASDDRIELNHLPPHIIDPRRADTASHANLLSLKTAKSLAVEKFEREYICDCLHKSNGNVTQAAKDADIHPTNLHAKIKKYNINPHAFKKSMNGSH
ncbi:MAG: sigma-54 dependent transcriptional regulator [bacterium]